MPIYARFLVFAKMVRIRPTGISYEASGKNILVNLTNPVLPSHSDRIKPADLITIDRPFCFNSYTHPLCSLQMPETSKDHTRSLVPYQKILEAWEAEYRETAPASQESVINKIVEQISTAAAKGKAKIADNENLQKVSI